MTARFIIDAAQRFWAKVDRRGADECWPWIGSTNEHGYGSIRIGGRAGALVKAHRVAYMLTTGEYDLEPADHICHRCDNPPCCNPAHLYRGDYLTNTSDKVTRGRQRRGRSHSASIARSVPRGDEHWTRRHPAKAAENAKSMLRNGPWNKGLRRAAR